MKLAIIGSGNVGSAVAAAAKNTGHEVVVADLERMAFLNISLNAKNNWSWQSGWKLVGPLS